MIEEIRPGYTRISDILKPFTKFDNIPPEVLHRAADRGTRVHEYCSAYANNIFLSDIDEDCEGYVDSFIQWYDENVVKLLYSEKRLYDDMLKITGQFDLIVKLEDSDEVVLIDIKTPERESNTWAIQLAAYSYLIAYDLKITIDVRKILRLSKDGKKATVTTYTDHKIHDILFFNACKLYEYFNRK